MNATPGLQMEALMQQQLEQVHRYIEYLDQIKLSISSNDSEQLQKLVEKPPLDTIEIEHNQQQQLSLLGSAGFTQDELDAFIQQQSDHTKLAELRQQLKKQLGKLEQSLLINNLLLQKSQQRVKQSIRLLSGRDISSAPASYSRSGSVESTGKNGRVLAQA